MPEDGSHIRALRRCALMKHGENEYQYRFKTLPPPYKKNGK